MIAIFNDNSLPEKYDGKKSETMMNTFIETCRLSYRACETINNRFYLYIKDNFFESPFIKKWIDLKGWNSDDVIFLLTITVNDENGKNIFVSMESDKKWSEPILTINGECVNNMSNTKHVYDHLKYFPIWNNYPFESWKPDFNADEKLLPVAELSDYIWLKYVEKPLSTYDPKKHREYYWMEFVRVLRNKPVDGVGAKEGFIIKIFLQISSINGFVQSKICKKFKRKIVEFPHKIKFYLTPDKQHGAFEVYNEKKVHQGEWNFFGRKNTNKSAIPTRDICK